MAAQPKCLQPLTFRVEGVGMPPGSTTDQSGLHNFPGSTGGRHGDGCTKSVVPCAFLSVGVCLVLCWWLKRGERPPCPAQQPLSTSPLCLYVCCVQTCQIKVVLEHGVAAGTGLSPAEITSRRSAGSFIPTCWFPTAVGSVR